MNNDSDTISVPRSSLLKIVRVLDIGTKYPDQEIAAALDDLRGAFTSDEIATGRVNMTETDNA